MKRFTAVCAFSLTIALAAAAFGADGLKIGSVDIQKVLLLSNPGKG